jgi:hypothetical protein
MIGTKQSIITMLDSIKAIYGLEYTSKSPSEMLNTDTETYLDMEIRIYDGQIRYRTYIKPQTFYTYISEVSNSPKTMILGIIKGELYRFAKTNDNKEDFNIMKEILFIKFNELGHNIKKKDFETYTFDSLRFIAKNYSISKRTPPKEIRNVLNRIKEKYVICNSDKNLAITVIEKNIYHSEVSKFLSNNEMFEIIETDKQWLKNIVQEYNKDLKINGYYRYTLHEIQIEEERYSVPTFYLISKVHKNPISYRPITNCSKWITKELSRNVSDYYNSKLKELIVLKDTLVILDSYEVAKEIDKLNKELTINEIEKLYIFTTDFKDMYNKNRKKRSDK